MSAHAGTPPRRKRLSGGATSPTSRPKRSSRRPITGARRERFVRRCRSPCRGTWSAGPRSRWTASTRAVTRRRSSGTTSGSSRAPRLDALSLGGPAHGVRAFVELDSHLVESVVREPPLDRGQHLWCRACRRFRHFDLPLAIVLHELDVETAEQLLGQ